MTPQAQQNIQDIETIRQQMLKGELSYDEAKAKAQPVLDRINKRNAEIAKKHGKRATKLSFAVVMR